MVTLPFRENSAGQQSEPTADSRNFLPKSCALTLKSILVKLKEASIKTNKCISLLMTGERKTYLHQGNPKQEKFQVQLVLVLGTECILSLFFQWKQ